MIVKGKSWAGPNIKKPIIPSYCLLLLKKGDRHILCENIKFKKYNVYKD